MTVRDPFDHNRSNRLKAIRKRWSAWSSQDIELHQPLPEWRQILKDIEFLSDVDLIEKAYEAGHRHAQTDYENGFADGRDEAYLGKQDK